MESESKQRTQRNRRRERAQEMKQERQRQAQQNNENGSGDEESPSPPMSRGREKTRHPPRRKKHSRSRSSSCEEVIVDGFAICSFASLDDMENEGGVHKAKPQRPERESKNEQRNDRPRKRNGLTRQSNSPPRSPRGNNCAPQVNGTSRPNSQEQLSDASSHSRTGSGYMCDSESEGDRVSEEGSDIFATTGTAPRRDLLTNVIAKSTQTNGGPSPESIPRRESTTLAAALTTTITTAVTAVTAPAPPASVAATSAPEPRPHGGREAFRSAQTELPRGGPKVPARTSVSTAGATVEVETKKPSALQPGQNPDQEQRNKEKERQPLLQDQDREKVLERKRERERCFSRSQVWPNGNQLGSSGNTQSQRPPPHHSPYAVPGPVPSYRLSPRLTPLQNPHSMFSTANVRPQTPLTSTALPMTAPAVAPTSNLFAAESNPNFNYPPTKGNQQQELIQELNNRFIHNQNVSYPPMPTFMSRETHMHQHMHQHQHTHSFLPPASPMMGSTLLPTPSPQLTREREQHKAFQLGIGIPPPPSGVSVMPPSSAMPAASIGNSLGSTGHGAFQPKKTGKWCRAHVSVAWLINEQQQKAKVESHKDPMSKPGSHIFPPHRHLDPRMQSFFPHGPPGLPHAPMPGAPHHSSLLAPPPNGQLGIPPLQKHNGYSPISALGLPPGNGGKVLGGMFGDREALSMPALSNNHPHWTRLYHAGPQGFPPMGHAWAKPEPERPKEGFLERDRLKEEERIREKEKQHEMERQRERERREATGNSEHGSRKEDSDHRLSVQNHDRGSSSRDPDGHGGGSQNGKLLDGRLGGGGPGGVRTSPAAASSRFPHDIRALDAHRDPRADSAFINVPHNNPLYHQKDDRREHDKERLDTLHNSVGLHTILEQRSRLEAAAAAASSSFNPPLHGLEPPPPMVHRGPPNPAAQWEMFGRGVHHLDQLRPPDILELERDRLLRTGLQPMVPVLEGAVDRFREREPHDFTRDNPLAFRRMEHHHMAQYLEERMIEEQRQRMMLGADHPSLLSKAMGPIASPFQFPRNTIYPFLTHKNGTPPTSQPPPPLISMMAANGMGPTFPTVSRPHSRNTSPPKMRDLLLKQEPMLGEHGQSSRDKSTPDKEAQSR